MYPWLVQHFISPALEAMLGRQTFARRRDLEISQWWSPEQLRELQARKLTKLFIQSASNCSWWKQVFDDSGLNPAGSDPFETLSKLPLLEKTSLKDNREAMTNHYVSGGAIPFNTGGSTGEPLIFYFDRRRISYDKAARMRTHSWFGHDHGQRELYLWGSTIEASRQDRFRSIRDKITNEKLLNAFNMTEDSMRKYLGEIESFDPVGLFGYPSSIALLCDFANSILRKVHPESLKVVFTTGEVLLENQRQVIEKYFDVPVADCYGSRDGGFIAHQCREGSMHITAESIILEVVDNNGKSVPKGETGEIVLTHLDNYAMPFIRYRTGDLGRLRSDVCSCGRGLPLMDVVTGRQTDHIVACDGSLQHALGLIYVLREVDAVRHFRIHQKADRSIDVHIVPRCGFGPKDSQRIDRGLRARLGQEAILRYHLENQISPLASGKHRYVVSEVQAETVAESSPEQQGQLT